MSEALHKALAALEANEQWHKDHDDHDGYEGSDLQEQNGTAITALCAALAQPPAPTAQPAESTTGQPLSDAEIFLTLAPLFPEATRNTFLVSVARAIEAAIGTHMTQQASTPDALCREAATEIERLCAAAALFTDNRSNSEPKT